MAIVVHWNVIRDRVMNALWRFLLLVTVRSLRRRFHALKVRIRLLALQSAQEVWPVGNTSVIVFVIRVNVFRAKSKFVLQRNVSVERLAKLSFVQRSRWNSTVLHRVGSCWTVGSTTVSLFVIQKNLFATPNAPKEPRLTAIAAKYRSRTNLARRF